MLLCSESQRQASTHALQLLVLQWNLVVGHIVQFAGDGIRHVAELLLLLVVLLGRSGRRLPLQPVNGLLDSFEKLQNTLAVAPGMNRYRKFLQSPSRPRPTSPLVPLRQ